VVEVPCPFILSGLLVRLRFLTADPEKTVRLTRVDGVKKLHRISTSPEISAVDRKNSLTWIEKEKSPLK
jgi:hypothetical protein